MKKALKSINRKSLLMFSALLIAGSLSATAQIGLPGGDDNIDDATPVPIDGFIITGLVAGAAIGLRKHIKGQK